MRQTEINIYIGSDNASRKINEEYLAKITEWAKQVFPNGFTLIKGKGFYGDISEDSVILDVMVFEVSSNLRKCVKSLKKILKQECILVSQKPTSFMPLNARIDPKDLIQKETLTITMRYKKGYVIRKLQKEK